MEMCSLGCSKFWTLWRVTGQIHFGLLLLRISEFYEPPEWKNIIQKIKNKNIWERSVYKTNNPGCFQLCSSEPLLFLCILFELSQQQCINMFIACFVCMLFVNVVYVRKWPQQWTTLYINNTLTNIIACVN